MNTPPTLINIGDKPCPKCGVGVMMPHSLDCLLVVIERWQQARETSIVQALGREIIAKNEVQRERNELRAKVADQDALLALDEDLIKMLRQESVELYKLVGELVDKLSIDHGPQFCGIDATSNCSTCELIIRAMEALKEKK